MLADWTDLAAMATRPSFWPASYWVGAFPGRLTACHSCPVFGAVSGIKEAQPVNTSTRAGQRAKGFMSGEL
jgi:hypothetical protein